MRYRELVLKTIYFKSTGKWLQEHNYLTKTANFEICKGIFMSITIKGNNARFFCQHLNQCLKKIIYNTKKI
jgi:hypothetical protein